MLTIDDLKPKPFTINVKGVELECQPLRLAHALTIAKIGSVFSETAKASAQEIEQAARDLDAVVGQVIPALKDVALDASASIELITQLVATIEPAESSALKESGITFENPDPKVQTAGETPG